MYMNDLGDAGLCTRNIQGEVYINKTVIPSIINGNITATIEIYA